MGIFLDFILKHYVLFSLFVVALLWLIVEEARHQGFGGRRLTTQAAVDLMNREHAQVVDIRDAAVFAEGHITNALNLPGGNIEKSQNAKLNDKNRPLIIVCANGQKSAHILQQLQKLGYNGYCLSGGMAAWKNANLPLVKNKK